MERPSHPTTTHADASQSLDSYRVHQINAQRRQMRQNIKLPVASHLCASNQSLLFSRKLGYDEVIPAASKWKILCDREFDSCWVSDLHSFTMFVWCEEIGQDAAQTTSEACLLGEDSETPYIVGAFTQHRPTKMLELIPFVKSKESSQPEWLQLLHRKG